MHALLLFALTAAPVDLAYGTGPLDLPRLAAVPDATLAQQVVACTKGYGVTRVERKGTPAKLVWSPSDAATNTLNETNRAERIALVSVLGRRLVGSEIDVLVAQTDGTSVPVSVTWEPDGLVTFESGPPVKTLVDATMTAEKIKSQFEVGDFTDVDAKWDGASLSLVQQALATLSKDELALVRGLHFRRGRAEGIHRAKYSRGDETNWISVYDSTFAFATEQFTGPVAAPRSEALIPLIHELGHALADVRFREKGVLSRAAAVEYKRRLPEVDAAIAAFNEKAKALGPNPPKAGLAELQALTDALAKARADSDARFKEADRLVKQMLANDKVNAQGRPVEKAFALVFNPRQSPTRYGKTAAKEHFAECFTLFKNDPEAMRRISATPFDWFTAGTHVTLSATPLEP